MTACPGAGKGPGRGATALLEAARKAEGQGRPDEALRHCLGLRDAVAKDRDALPRAYVRCLRLGAEAGDAKAVRGLAADALAAPALKGDDRAQARVRLAVAAALRRLGGIPEAQVAFALARAQGGRAGDRGLEAQALAGLAELAVIEGDYETAARHMDAITPLITALKGPGLAPAALAAARAARRVMDLPRARRLAEQALRSHETRRERVAVSSSLIELSRIEEESGDRRAAAGFAQEAIRRLQGEGFSRRAALLQWTFAGWLSAWGEQREAERHHGLAEKALARLGDRYATARLGLALGQALGRQGRHRDALARLERAAKDLESLGDRFGAGQARILVAQSRAQAGEPAEAIGELTQALDHAGAVRSPELTFRAYALLGHISDRLLDRGAQAERFHRGAVTALEQLQSGVDPLGEGEDGAEESAYFELARVAVRQWRRSGDPSQVDAVLAAVERSRARQLLRVFSQVGASLADSPADRQRVRALSGQERFLAEAMERPGGTPALRRELFQRLRAAREARTKIEAGALRIDAAQPTAVTAGILKQALSDEDLLLVYLVGTNGSLLLTMTNRDVLLTDLPGRLALARAVEPFRLLVDGPSRPRTAAMRSAGDALRKLLVDPAGAHLKGRRRVYLVLSGPLWSIPFAALPDRDGVSLGTRHAFLRVPSPAGWLKLRDTPRAQTAGRALRVLALAGGAFGAGRSSLRSALSYRGHTLRPSADALTEGRALLAAVKPRTAPAPRRWRRPARAPAPTPEPEPDLDPREAALHKDGLTDARWVHFASPLVLPARLQGPLQPALLVAPGAGGPGDDGLLLLGELLGLSLDAQLLSVAELDLGRGAPHPLAADSLARALQIAGVKSVLVPRQAQGTPPAAWFAAFLQTLYRRLAAGDDLSAAQLAAYQTLANAYPGDPRPLGAFSLYGAD